MRAYFIMWRNPNPVQLAILELCHKKKKKKPTPCVYDAMCVLTINETTFPASTEYTLLTDSAPAVATVLEILPKIQLKALFIFSYCENYLPLDNLQNCSLELNQLTCSDVRIISQQFYNSLCKLTQLYSTVILHISKILNKKSYVWYFNI